MQRNAITGTKLYTVLYRIVMYDQTKVKNFPVQPGTDRQNERMTDYDQCCIVCYFTFLSGSMYTIASIQAKFNDSAVVRLEGLIHREILYY